MIEPSMRMALSVNLTDFRESGKASVRLGLTAAS